MKRFYMFFVMIMSLLLLSSCGEDEVPAEPFEFIGYFVDYNEVSTEDGSISKIMTIDCDGVYTDIHITGEVAGISEYTSEYRLSVSGNKKDDVYFGDLVSVIEVPLYIELGYSGEDLLSNNMEQYTFRSVLTQIDASFIREQRGRKYNFGVSASYYLSQDEKATYYNLVRTDNKEDGSSVSSSISVYADRLSGDWYRLVNYGAWEKNTGYTGELFTIALSSVNVDVFERTGTELVVSGSVSSLSDNPYLEYVVRETLGDLYIENPEVSFTAKFKESNKELVYIEFVISYENPITIDGSNYTAQEVKVVMNGIDFNNEKSVVIPGHVTNVTPTEDIEQSVVPELVPLCSSHFGVSAEDLTVDFVVSVIGDISQNDEIIAAYNYDDVLAAAINILSSWTYEQVMVADAGSLSAEEMVAVEAIKNVLP